MTRCMAVDTDARLRAAACGCLTGAMATLVARSASSLLLSQSLQQLVEMDLFVEHGGGQVPASARQAGMARSDKGAKSWAASRQSPAPTPIRLGKQPSLTGARRGHQPHDKHCMLACPTCVRHVTGVSSRGPAGFFGS